ncbi:MAG: NUDIX domain-containing protein [Microbacteriaceae bacterium]
MSESPVEPPVEPPTEPSAESPAEQPAEPASAAGRSTEGPETHGPGRPPLPPPHLRDPGDAWVEGPDGERFWGRFGAAGLLVHHEGTVLLQHRVAWSHFGGTWGLPGGARRLGESAEQGARREAAEEAGVPGGAAVTVEFEHVLDLGFWTYTTVVVRASRRFVPVMGDAESLELRWVRFAQVGELPLHPGFEATWPALRARIEQLA